jgi:hypothetical protein
MVEVIRYNDSYKSQWDKFVKQAKNGTFLFYRDYMEYHKDRFEDYSLLLYDKGKLVALLPANIKGDILYSHQGLTFGGFITDKVMKASLMLNIFQSVKEYYANVGIKSFYYKCIPYIYAKLPAEEDKYALFRHNAKLVRRDITTTIDLNNKLKYSTLRQRCIKKAKSNNLIVKESSNYGEFWEILTQTLDRRHNAIPVHSIDEITNLAKKFPDNIKLYVAQNENGKIVAGTVVYINDAAVHTQYLSNSIAGNNIGALDYVIDYLINIVFRNKHFLDFGISNEKEGAYLNKGLIGQKEGFGGRAVVHDLYEIDIL